MGIQLKTVTPKPCTQSQGTMRDHQSVKKRKDTELSLFRHFGYRACGTLFHGTWLTLTWLRTRNIGIPRTNATDPSSLVTRDDSEPFQSVRAQKSEIHSHFEVFDAVGTTCGGLSHLTVALNHEFRILDGFCCGFM